MELAAYLRPARRWPLALPPPRRVGRARLLQDLTGAKVATGLGDWGLIEERMGTRVGERELSLGFEHHHRRGEVGQRDLKELFLVPQAEFAPPDLFVHGSNGIEHLGEIGFLRPSKRPDRLPSHQPAGEIHQFSKRHAQSFLDSTGCNEGDQRCEERPGQQPVNGIGRVTGP